MPIIVIEDTFVELKCYLIFNFIYSPEMEKNQSRKNKKTSHFESSFYIYGKSFY